MTTEHTTITPVGTVIAYHATTAPEGYFACDGAEFDAAVYPKLAAVLGESKVPDLRGYFIRGYATNNDVNKNGAGRALCSEQGDAIRNITGECRPSIPINPDGGVNSWRCSLHFPTGAFKEKSTIANIAYFTPTGRTTGQMPTEITFDASRTPVPVAAENRPKNVNLLYCIKHDEPETLPIPAKASTAETIAGVNDSKYTTPFGIKAAIDHAISLIKQCVCVKASTDEAVAGTDDTKYVPSAGVAAAIAESACNCPPGGSGGGFIPNLRFGQETRWPLLYNNKQVYAKLVDFGQLPANGERDAAHGIADIEWCQVSWDYSTVRKSGDADLATLGVISTAPPSYGIHWRIFVDKTNIQAQPLNASNNNTDWSAVVCVLYTKTTDEPLP